MSAQDNGGPAFPTPDLSAYGIGPCSSPDGNEYRIYGMSLRDWFAGQALAGMMADSFMHESAERIAFGSYAMADAMLAERAKKGGAA